MLPKRRRLVSFPLGFCIVQRKTQSCAGIKSMAIQKGGKSSRASSSSPCAHLRTAYNNCFNRWYSEKFLKGQWDKEECVSEWRKYQACLYQHLEDKNLRSFLEGEGAVDPANQPDSETPAGGASQ